ncbi:fluoroquinolone resistance protein [Pedobacter sp. UYP24]
MLTNEEPVLHEDKTFTNIDYSEKRLTNREFVNCEFINCNFEKSDLKGNDFMDCKFKQCNFSMAILYGTGLKDVVFTGCKILGVDFTRCNKFLFSFEFNQCYLDYSTFYGVKVKKINFTDCALKEVDFTECDLSGSVFKNSDLLGAKFSGTILEKTDFRTAFNFSIDPEINRMKKAKFAVNNLIGLLDNHNLDIE